MFAPKIKFNIQKQKINEELLLKLIYLIKAFRVFF